MSELLVRSHRLASAIRRARRWLRSNPATARSSITIVSRATRFTVRRQAGGGLSR
jgi:hypothetical protein